MFRKVDTKSPTALVSEWDVLAPIRYRQITHGEDITFRHVLAPTMLGLASREHAERIVDAGCGVGVLTNLLAQEGTSVTGVDPSGESIEIARANFGGNAEFVQSTLESYAEHRPGCVDLMIANMVLMDVLDIKSFCV
jgi:2-polyprenyl-3-methyl-5-hydroxy-6-metoxy-1,4-benzoquinol methylase